MSSTEVFCLVEGVANDRYVYSQLTTPVFKKSGIRAEYPAANLLSSDGTHGGKGLLLKFYDFLRAGRLLSSSVQGKKTTFVFLLDKDVDDMIGNVRRSKHVFYTEHYDIQNYLFLYGDVLNSAAAGASIPVDSVAQTLGASSAWLYGCMMTWKEWVTMCLFLKVNNISLAGYGLSSQVNFKEYGKTEQPLLEKYKNLAFRKSGLDRATFDARYSAVEGAVREIYATGNAGRIFKGKWFLHWLENHLETKHQTKVGHKQLASILSSNVDWNGDWTKPYKYKMARIVREHVRPA